MLGVVLKGMKNCQNGFEDIPPEQAQKLDAINQIDNLH